MDDIWSTITPREKEVLDLLMHGLTAKEIAKQLGITHRTVEGYTSRLRRKLGVTNKAAMAAKVTFRDMASNIPPAKITDRGDD